MQKFNQVITIEVSVDSIAQQLLSNLNPDFKHRELVVESLIGRMLTADKSGISHLYNSLNGFTDDINFQVGETIVPENLSCYGYWETDTEGNRKRSDKNIPYAQIKSIDKYADRKIEIEFTVPNSNGVHESRTQWIHHTHCSKSDILSQEDLKNETELNSLEAQSH